MRAFEAWRDSLGTVPTIKALRSKAESIRSLEFEKAVSKLRAGVGPSGAPMDLKALKTVEELSRWGVRGGWERKRGDSAAGAAGCGGRGTEARVGRAM